MKDLASIARYMRLPEEQLRYPIELLNQGYEPTYLATYRPDELGNIDENALAILKRALHYSAALKAHKEKVKGTLERDHQWNETVAEVIQDANTISQVDAVTRHLRAKRNSRSIIEKCPQVEAVGQAILTLQNEAPKDMMAWVSEVASVPLDQADMVLTQTKRWIQHLLSEDVRLIQQLQKQLLQKGSISIKVLPDPPKGSEAEKQLDLSEGHAPTHHAPSHHAPDSQLHALADAPPASPQPDDNQPLAIDGVSEQVVAPEFISGSAGESCAIATDGSPSDASSSDSSSSDSSSSDGGVPSAEGASQTDTTSVTNLETLAEVVHEPIVSATEGTEVSVAPLIAEFHQGRKQGKAIKTKTLSDKQLSPRQRRRKWLRSIVETYAKLKKPLKALTPYQILMLSRGQRSQIASVQFHFDERQLVQLCRESLCAGRHPLHHLLLEIATEGLKNHILPKLQQDVFAILEEDAYTDLTEAAVVHLHGSLMQRPIRGHRILLIDSIGPKQAAVAIVDADGKVVFTGEIPCNSNRAEIVAQNVVMLGQWVHEHRVTLVAISNGPSRRYLIHTISELLKQSSEGSLYWTIADRAGADAYCMTRTCLIELPKISRRHRAAVWLARRLQDPLSQILKVDPARLRLGSYQRELPQRELEHALQDAVSSAITKEGVDVFHADADVLKRIPGMSPEAAKAITSARQEEKFTNREGLMKLLREHLSEMNARQAIGFLRVYGSESALDGTMIHPEDYRLAERLVSHASLGLPETTPPGWEKPNYAEIAAATAEAIKGNVVDAVSPTPETAFGHDADTAFPTSDIDAEEHADEGDTHSTFGMVAESEPAAVPETTAEVVANDPAEISPEPAPTEDTPSLVDESAAPQSSDAPPPSEQSEQVVAPGVSVSMPPIPTTPLERPALSIDVEKLARSWQVGREKMRRVASCLQFPFTDIRDFQNPIPLLSKVPRLDTLQSGTMLSALVIGVADFGVVVDLGPECSGLIHISRLAPEFVEDPHQFVQVGDIVSVWVLNVDESRKRVSLTAIPPGTRRQDSGAQDHGRSDEAHARPAHSDRNSRGGSSGGAPRSGSSGQRSDRPAGGSDRPQGAGGGSGRPPQNRSFGGKPSGGRDGNRDRGRRRDGEDSNSSAPHRPTKVEPARPVTPISEAMQTGKEPLRSFSDLMQFIKKQRDEPESDVSATAPSRPAGSVGDANMASQTMTDDSQSQPAASQSSTTVANVESGSTNDQPNDGPESTSPA